MSIFSFAKRRRESKEEDGDEVRSEISVRVVIEEDEDGFLRNSTGASGLNH